MPFSSFVGAKRDKLRNRLEKLDLNKNIFAKYEMRLVSSERYSRHFI